jgi:hypothetical protein
MSDAESRRGRRFGRARNRKPSGPKPDERRANDAFKEEPREKLPAPPCPLCQKPVYDIFSAIAEGSDDAPAHFECVLKRLTELEAPGQGERLVYLGAGSFAIITGANGQGGGFVIKKRIQYELKDKKLEWRRNAMRVKA